MDLTETEFAIFIYLMLSLRPKDLTNQNLVIIRVLTIKRLHEIIQDINDTQDTKRIKKNTSQTTQGSTAFAGPWF